jgi:hypothetical protein
VENLNLPSEEERRKVFESYRQLPVSADDKKWRLGEQDFEMLMKQLDNVVSQSSPVFDGYTNVVYLLVWYK